MFLILNKAEKFYLQPLFHRNTGRRESRKAFETRVEWKEAGFPSMAVFVADTDYSISTLEKYSCDFGWQKLKDDYFILLAEVKAEKKQAQIDKMEEEYVEIWENLRNTLKSRIADLNDKIVDCATEKEIKTLFNEFNNLVKNLDQIQKAERLNYHLPNNYKESEKIELQQNGELNISADVTLDKFIDDDLLREIIEHEYKEESDE